MKKIFALMLTLVTLLSLCACAGGTDQPVNTESVTTEAATEAKPSMNELLSTAVVIDGSALYEEYKSNPVKVSSDYEGKTCLMEGTVERIEADHISVIFSNTLINVFLPTEDIIELQKDQYVEVVGIAESIGDEVVNGNRPCVTIEFRVGYLSKTTYTKTGVFHAYTTTDGIHPQDDCIEIVNDYGNTYYLELILTDEQKATLTSGDEITVEGPMYINDSTYTGSSYAKLDVKSIS